MLLDLVIDLADSIARRVVHEGYIDRGLINTHF